MEFSWRKIRTSLGGRGKSRDVREDLQRIGRYEDAPVFAELLDIRISPHDWTTLWGAAALGFADLVERMRRGGADIEARDEHGDTALIFAVRFRRPQIVRVLLDRGAAPDAAPA